MACSHFQLNPFVIEIIAWICADVSFELGTIVAKSKNIILDYLCRHSITNINDHVIVFTTLQIIFTYLEATMGTT